MPATFVLKTEIMLQGSLQVSVMNEHAFLGHLKRMSSPNVFQLKKKKKRYVKLMGEVFLKVIIAQTVVAVTLGQHFQ